MLGNRKYIAIIGMDDYLVTQIERGTCSNIDKGSGKRKAIRYCSEKVFGGHYFQGE